VDTIKSLRASFRALENEFRAHQREVRRIRNEARKAEDEARRTELEKQWQAAEEEELKRIPYEEEMELCTYLVSYLETTYCKGIQEAAPENEEPAAAGAFEGLVLSGKKATKNHDEDYLSLNKATGKKKGRGKKRGGLKVNERIMLVPETIEIFGLLSLEPPSTVSGVVDAVKRLKDKKNLVLHSRARRHAINSRQAAGRTSWEAAYKPRSKGCKELFYVPRGRKCEAWGPRIQCSRSSEC